MLPLPISCFQARPQTVAAARCVADESSWDLGLCRPAFTLPAVKGSTAPFRPRRRAVGIGRACVPPANANHKPGHIRYPGLALRGASGHKQRRLWSLCIPIPLWHVVAPQLGFQTVIYHRVHRAARERTRLYSQYRSFGDYGTLLCSLHNPATCFSLKHFSVSLSCPRC